MVGDLSNTRVAIYASYDDWNMFRPFRMISSVGAGTAVAYQMLNVPPGTYYLDAWKDVDNDGFWDEGDYYGLYGSVAWPELNPQPIPLAADETRFIDLTMGLIGEPTPVEQSTWGRVKTLFR